jgi:hypothetical protein
MGDDQLDELPAGPAAIAGDVVSPALLERVAVAQRRSAGVLRANGRHAEAARAELYGVRARLALEHPNATRQVHRLA